MSDIRFTLGTDVTFEQASAYIRQMVDDWEKLKSTIASAKIVSDKDIGNLAKSVNQVQKLATNAERYTKQQELAGGIIGKQEAEVRKLRHEWKAAATEAEKLEKKAKLDRVQRQLKAAKSSTSEWTKALGSFAFKFNALGNIAANVLSRVTQLAKQAAREALKIIMDFEQAMADVRAITGATDAEFKRLERSARELGGSTKFTATQVAQLQKEYSKLGFSTQEILDASEATLSLAAATGTDLPRSAEVAGATIRAFGLDTTETQRIVDVMADSFTSSALDMERFAESMKYVAPVSKAMGVSVEETTAMLSALANAGIHGSQAGTALRRIFLQLAKDGRPVAERMGELAQNGISVADAQDEVGQRAATAMLVLSEQETLIRELTDAYHESAGAAKEMADVQIDTLKGQLTILKSALSEYVLELNESSGASDVAKESVRGLTSAIQLHTEAMKYISLYTNLATLNWIGLAKGGKNLADELNAVNDATVKYASNEVTGAFLERAKAHAEAMEEVETKTDGAKQSFDEYLKLIKQFVAETKATQALEDEAADEAWEYALTLMPPPDVQEEDRAYQESLKQAMTDKTNHEIAEYERATAARNAAFKKEQTELLRKQEIYNTFSDAVLQITNQSIAQGELTLAKFGEIVIIGMLDMLRKFILMQQAKVLAAAMTTPDSIATFGAAGLAKAAIINGLITAAFGAAKAAISGKFAEGGYTGEGDFRDETGERVAGVVHEREFVINRRQTAKYKPLLEDINAGRDHAVWNALNIDLNKSHTGIDYTRKLYEHVSQNQISGYEDNEYYYIKKGNTIRKVAKT